jgi:hypothetical protein
MIEIQRKIMTMILPDNMIKVCFIQKFLAVSGEINYYYIKNIKKVRIKKVDAEITANLNRVYDQSLKMNLGGDFLTFFLETWPAPFCKAYSVPSSIA